MFTFSPTEAQGIVAREVRVRLLNCSTSGCLLEANVRLEVGTTGSLRVRIDGAEFSDDIQVVRCLPLPGSGSLHHVGARFLWTAPPDRLALRRVAKMVAAAPLGASLT